MAKQDGILKIEGTLESLTFYKSTDGYRVRKKGGVSRNRILHDPAFIRTRENVSEFGECATAGKLFRQAAGSLISRAKDGKLTSRLTSVLSKVKNNDLVSPRGQRSVAKGLETVQGKSLLKGFDFNGKATMDSVLRSDKVLDTATGAISFSGFKASEHLSSPSGATHYSMQAAVLQIDLDGKTYGLSASEIQNAALAPEAANFSLEPPGLPAGNGVLLYLLLIQFFQEVNGVQYPLKNGSHNVLHVLETA